MTTTVRDVESAGWSELSPRGRDTEMPNSKYSSAEASSTTVLTLPREMTHQVEHCRRLLSWDWGFRQAHEAWGVLVYLGATVIDLDHTARAEAGDATDGCRRGEPSLGVVTLRRSLVLRAL